MGILDNEIFIRDLKSLVSRMEKTQWETPKIKSEFVTFDKITTREDLRNIWELQNGICFFSGVKLVLSSYSKINKNPIYTASLDRIDSSKGYSIDNIRWVSRAMNWMKNNMSDDMVHELLEIIRNKKTPK